MKHILTHTVSSKIQTITNVAQIDRIIFGTFSLKKYSIFPKKNYFSSFEARDYPSNPSFKWMKNRNKQTN